MCGPCQQLDGNCCMSHVTMSTPVKRRAHPLVKGGWQGTMNGSCINSRAYRFRGRDPAPAHGCSAGPCGGGGCVLGVSAEEAGKREGFRTAVNRPPGWRSCRLTPVPGVERRHCMETLPGREDLWWRQRRVQDSAFRDLAPCRNRPMFLPRCSQPRSEPGASSQLAERTP